MLQIDVFFSSQRKEAIGDDDTLPEDITTNLKEITKEKCDVLTVFQLKKVRSLIDEAMAVNNQVLEDQAKLRDDTLREIGNWLHPSVPVSNDEVSDNLPLLDFIALLARAFILSFFIGCR